MCIFLQKWTNTWLVCPVWLPGPGSQRTAGRGGSSSNSSAVTASAAVHVEPCTHVTSIACVCVGVRGCAAAGTLSQVLLYHRSACDAVDEDSLLELADWAVRKLAYLNTDAHQHAAAKGEEA